MYFLCVGSLVVWPVDVQAGGCWLHLVLVVVRGIFVEVIFVAARGIFVEARGIFVEACGIFRCVAWASLRCVGFSLVVACGFSLSS